MSADRYESCADRYERCEGCGRHVREIFRWLGWHRYPWVCPDCAGGQAHRTYTTYKSYGLRLPPPLPPRIQYPVVCAWCNAEGVRNVLYHTTVEHSHGICKRHAAELMRQAREVWAAEVVAQGNTRAPERIGAPGVAVEVAP